MPSAADIESLRDLSTHFGYLVKSVGEIGVQVKYLTDHMANKVELEALRVEVRRDLDALGVEFRREMAAVRADMQAKSLSTQFERGLTLVTKICAAVLAVIAVGGAVALMVRFIDRVPDAVPVVGKP